MLSSHMEKRMQLLESSGKVIEIFASIIAILYNSANSLTLNRHSEYIAS